MVRACPDETARRAAGGERLDTRQLVRRLEGEGEVLQRLPGRDLRGLQHRLDAPLLPAAALRLQQATEEDMGRRLGTHRLGQQWLQRVDGVAAVERDELVARGVGVELHPRLHPRRCCTPVMAISRSRVWNIDMLTPSQTPSPQLSAQTTSAPADTILTGRIPL